MLNYHKTVDSLQSMFPFIDRTVIENVIEANDGHIENTVECLLEIDYPVDDQPVVIEQRNENVIENQKNADEQLAIMLQEALYNSEFVKTYHQSGSSRKAHNEYCLFL